MFQNGVSTSTANAAVTTTVSSNTVVHETPYVARSVVSAVPPHLIHELSLRWTFTLIGGTYQSLVETIGELSIGDVAWFSVIGLVVFLLYHWRSYFIPMLSGVWEELEDDVAVFLERQFPSAREELPPACTELLPGSIIVSAGDMKVLHTSADAIQRRIDNLRMSRFNVIRSRHAGVVLDLRTCDKLRKQLTDTQNALERETNARADAEEELAELKASLKAERPVQDGNGEFETVEEIKEDSPAADDMSSRHILEEGNSSPSTTLETIQETEEESPAADGMNSRPIPEQPEVTGSQTNADVERLQKQLEVEQANYKFVFKKKEIFRHGGKNLKQKLDDLQAEYNELEDSRDTWKETCEAMEEQADVRAVRALRDRMNSDNQHNQRRIDALENQLRFESTSREEAQSVARDLQERNQSLQENLEEANEMIENLQTAFDELDIMQDPEETAKEDKDDKSTEANAKLERLLAEVKELDRLHAELEAKEAGAAENAAAGRKDENWQKYDLTLPQQQGLRTINVEEGAPLRRIQSAPLWLPAPHHGDNFDPLYDVSDYGDDDDDREDGDDEDCDDDEADNDLPGPEPSSQGPCSGLNGSAPEFVPSVRLKKLIPPSLPHHQAYIASKQGGNSSDSGSACAPESAGEDSVHDRTAAPKAAGPGQAKNPHIQKLNQEVKRLDWRRKSGMPDSVEDEEGVPGPDDVLDDMFDRQVTQALNPTPIHCARGSMWGALNDIPNLPENTSTRSAPSSGSRHAHSNGSQGRSEPSVEGILHEGKARTNLAGGSAMASHVSAVEDVLASSSVQQSQEGPQIMDYRPSTIEAAVTPDAINEMNQAIGEDLIQITSRRDNESMRAPNDEATQKANSPGESESDVESGNDGEWSDVGDEDDAEKEGDGAPMLGKYKVTRGHSSDQEDDGMPMLGNYKVTRGPTPVNFQSEMPMLGKYKVTRGEPPANSDSEAPRAEEESGDNRDSGDVEDEDDEEEEEDTEGKEDEKPSKDDLIAPKAEEASNDNSQRSPPFPALARDISQQDFAAPHPVSQSQPPDQQPSSPMTDANDTTSSAAQGQIHTEPNAKTAHHGQSARRLPSNYWAGIETAERTHAEEIGDAFTDYFQKHATKPLADSMWANKPDAKAQATHQQKRSSLAESVSTPQTPNQSGAGEVTRAPPHPQNTPAGTGLGNSSWSPRGNGRGRGGRGARGPRMLPTNTSTHSPFANTPGATPTQAGTGDDFNILGAGRRRTPQVPQFPAQNPPANDRSTGPSRPAAGNGNWNPGFGGRGRGGSRGGRGGPFTPTPRSGPARDSKSRSATSESVQRWQESSARAAAEEAKKQQQQQG